VLIVYSPFLNFDADVKAKLDGTGAFTKVDLFDAISKTPTADELAAYEAVLTYSYNSYANSTALGDLLADYWDAGGRVVIAACANEKEPFGLTGRWLSGGYHLFNLTGEMTEKVENGPLAKVKPDSPLLVGVENLTAENGFRVPDEPVSGAVVVARGGTSGDPLIVQGEKDGRNLVALNFYPPSATAYSTSTSSPYNNYLWVGDGAAIMRNALLF
jgi:hypothetical protein